MMSVESTSGNAYSDVALQELTSRTVIATIDHVIAVCSAEVCVRI
jgi:hypothetical protein